MEATKIVANNIKKIVKEKGLKQISIAEKIGITPNMFSNLLHGRKIITVEHIFAIAKALDIPVSELFETGDERK